MTEFWVCFSCCIAEQPQPKRRRRIDRSMIGEPMNFVHTTHVGSGDMGNGPGSVSKMKCCSVGSGDMGNGPGSAGLIQDQMKSKGGYGNEMSNVQE